jgi:hypothetical protein
VHHLPVRGVVALLALAPVLAGCSLLGLGAASPQPIAAYWTNPPGGVLQVKATADGFQGLVVEPRTGGSCPEPRGAVFIKAKGSGAHYTGQVQWWHTPGCDYKYSDKMTLDLKDGDKTAHMCSTNPFSSGPRDSCVDLKRVDNYKPPK